MKPSFKHFFYASLACTLAVVGCTDDDGDTIPNRAPTLTVSNPDGSSSGETIRITNLDPRAQSEYRIVATDADGNIDRLVVQMNGTDVGIPSSDVSLTVDGNVTPLPANPLLILNAEKNGFTKTIRLRSAQNFGDSTTYRFIVRDSDGEEDAITVVIVNKVPPTPLATEIKNARFFNFAATVARPGAIDLDTGDAKPSSNDTSSELQDQGNASGGEWRRFWVPENGAKLYKAPAGSKADYDVMTNLNQLNALFSRAGAELAQSDKIEKNDVYLVRRTDATVGEKIYAVLVVDVVDNVGSETDEYVVSIKQN